MSKDMNKIIEVNKSSQNHKYHVRIPIRFWENRFPNWNESSEEQQMKMKLLVIKQISEHLESDKSTLLTDKEDPFDGIQITLINPDIKEMTQILVDLAFHIRSMGAVNIGEFSDYGQRILKLFPKYGKEDDDGV